MHFQYQNRRGEFVGLKSEPQLLSGNKRKTYQINKNIYSK